MAQAPRPDPRDTEHTAAITAAVIGMIRAVHYGDHPRLIGELNLLLPSILEFNKTLGERPSDAARRRAVERLSR